MVRQAFLIIPSKSHEASLPYPGETKMRGPDGRTSCNSVDVLLRKAYMLLYWLSARDNHCFPDNVFAVIWLFPTRLPACPPIVGAFERSLQLWCESRKLFAAVSVCIIRHIEYQDTWSWTPQVIVNIRRLEAFHVLFLWLLMNVFLLFFSFFFLSPDRVTLRPICNYVQ